MSQLKIKVILISFFKNQRFIIKDNLTITKKKSKTKVIMIKSKVETTLGVLLNLLNA